MSDYFTRRETMVDTQVRPSDVTKFPIIEAMLAVPREQFVPAAKREAAYMGENIDLGGGRVLLEARTLAKLLDAVDIQPDESVLDIGCAYGYSSAVIARMAGSVVAVEEDAEMAAAAQAVAAKVVAGPLASGAAGSFDVVILQGGVEEIPAAIEAQVRDGGRIIAVFMQGALGTARIGFKADGQINWRYAFNATAPVLPGFAKARVFAL
ncbi:MAG: methyltransferase domain-containing protein [Cypionkella sp.]